MLPSSRFLGSTVPVLPLACVPNIFSINNPSALETFRSLTFASSLAPEVPRISIVSSSILDRVCQVSFVAQTQKTDSHNGFLESSFCSWSNCPAFISMYHSIGSFRHIQYLLYVVKQVASSHAIDGSVIQKRVVPSDLPGSWTYVGCYQYGHKLSKT